MEELDYFLLKLDEQYKNEKDMIIDLLKEQRYTTFRVNTLVSSCEEVESYLKENQIEFRKTNLYDMAYILKPNMENYLYNTSLFKDGKIYLQSLSSMIPPLVLNPIQGKDILDMAAAPGGKTTQLQVLASNKAQITACEFNKIRAEKLKYNINMQHCKNISVLNIDARQIDEFFRFDQILLDAPCSGSGIRDINNVDTFKGFRKELVLKSVKSQYQLLKKAFKILKPNGELVYSTCSILKEENEDVVINALKNEKYEIIPIDINDDKLIKLPVTIKGALCVCPNKYYEGFFVCKIKKCE